MITFHRLQPDPAKCFNDNYNSHQKLGSTSTQPIIENSQFHLYYHQPTKELFRENDAILRDYLRNCRETRMDADRVVQASQDCPELIEG